MMPILVARAGRDKEPDGHAHGKVDGAVEYKYPGERAVACNLKLCIHPKRYEVDDKGRNRTDALGISEHGALLLLGAEHTDGLDKCGPEDYVGHRHEPVQYVNYHKARNQRVNESQHGEHQHGKYQHLSVVKPVDQYARGYIQHSLYYRVDAHHGAYFRICN